MRAQPSRAQALALLGLGAVLGVLSAGTDAAGALLAGTGAVVAAALGLRDLLLVPSLRADARGLDVRHGAGRTRLGWDEVRGLRTVTDRRAVLLEVDVADGRVLLLSRGRLGRDPRDVLEELLAVRP